MIYSHPLTLIKSIISLKKGFVYIYKISSYNIEFSNLKILF